MDRNLAFSIVFIGVAGYWVHATVPILSFGAGAFIGTLRFAFNARWQKAMIVPTLMVVVYCLISAITSVFSGSNIETTLRVLLTPLLSILAVSVNKFSQDQLFALAATAGLSSLVAGILMYFQIGPMQVDLSVERLLSLNRADGYWLGQSFFQGAPSIGAPLGLGASVCLGLALSTRGFHRGILALGGGVAVVLLLLSLSRGATAGVVVAVIFGGIIWQSRAKFAIKSFSATIFVLGGIIFVGSIAYQLALDNIPGALVRYQALEAGVGFDRSLQERLNVWVEAASLAASNPAGLGFSYVSRGYLVSGYSAHNEYLGTLVSTGFLGLAFLLSIAAIAFRRSCKSALIHPDGTSARLALVCTISLVFAGVVGMAEHFSVSSSRFLYPMFWLFIGLALLQGRKASEFGTSGVR